MAIVLAREKEGSGDELEVEAGRRRTWLGCCGIRTVARGRPADPLSSLTPNDDFRKQALQAQETQLLIQKAEDERRASAKGLAQQQQQQALDDQLTLDKIRDDSASNQKKRDKKIEEYQSVVARREREAKKKNDKSLLISAEQQEKDIAAIKEK